MLLVEFGTKIIGSQIQGSSDFTVRFNPYAIPAIGILNRNVIETGMNLIDPKVLSRTFTR